MPVGRQKGEKTLEDAWSYDNGSGSNDPDLLFFAACSACVVAGGTAYNCGLFVFYNVGGTVMKIVVLQPAGVFRKILSFFIRNKKDKK